MGAAVVLRPLSQT